MRGEMIRQRLHDGKRVYGTHVCSLTNPLTASMEAELEFDFVFVCNEHMPIDRTETAMLCQFYASRGVSPIVRVPEPHAISAAMVLDAGAQGVVAPYVETAEQVRMMVGAVKYRPIKGHMLEELLSGRRTLKPHTREFLNTFNRDNYLIIGIESIYAVEHLDELLSVPGVDGVFIGPHDLSTTMEIPEQYTCDQFVETVESVIRTSRRHSVGVGLHTQLPNLPEPILKRYFDAGLNWVINGSDITAMRQGMGGQLQVLRRLGGDTFERQPIANGPVRSCLG